MFIFVSPNGGTRQLDWLVDFNFGIEFEPCLSARMRYVVQVSYPDLNNWVHLKKRTLLSRQIKRLSVHAAKTQDWLLEFLCLWFLANKGADRHKTELISFLQLSQPPFDGVERDELRERLIDPLIVFWLEVRQMQRNRRSTRRRLINTGYEVAPGYGNS